MSQFKLPAEIRAGALDVAARQGLLPDSPGKMLGDEFHFCAAACVAFAGLQGRSTIDARVFRDGLEKGAGKQAVVDAFLALGLSRASCEEMMKINDMSAENTRLAVLEGILQG